MPVLPSYALGVIASAFETISAATYARLTRFSLWALTIIVVSGAAVRLTGSGLGCSDWPSCEEDQFVASLDYHALIEFVNRLFTGVVAVAVILAVLGSMRREPRKRELTLWSWGLVAGVIAQILLGALLVKTELDPRFTMGHFLLSMVLLWNAVILDEKARDGSSSTLPMSSASWQPEGNPRRLMKAVCLGGACLLVTGTIVTGAGPHAGDTRAERLPYLVREVTRVHSGVAIAVLLLVLITWRALRSQPEALGFRRIAALLVIQGAVGYTQYFTGVPVLLVGVHVALASITWIEIVRSTRAAFSRPTTGSANASLTEVAAGAVTSS